MPSWVDDDLEERRQRGLFRVRRRLRSAQGAHIRLGRRELINFSSNDYLGLAADPRLARAAARAAKRYGCGAGASPLMSGLLPPLRALERRLAQWERTEAAVVFPSGFAANLGVLSAIAGPDDTIFSDDLNHASLIDGCRLSRARVVVYRHVDTNQLGDRLRRAGSRRRRIIVTDTVFSMEGDIAPLADLYDLAEQHDALLVIDEAHATGVLGRNGRGAAELTPPPASFDPDRLVRIGTLSKALGSQGGFVCGSRRLTSWVVNHARPYIFSTALAPPAAAAARRAIAIADEEPYRRMRALALASALRQALRERNYPVRGDGTAIVPIVFGDVEATMQVAALLRKQGILAAAIRPPSVPEGGARVRLSLSAGHSPEDFLTLISTLELASGGRIDAAVIGVSS